MMLKLFYLKELNMILKLLNNKHCRRLCLKYIDFQWWKWKQNQKEQTVQQDKELQD